MFGNKKRVCNILKKIRGYKGQTGLLWDIYVIYFTLNSITKPGWWTSISMEGVDLKYFKNKIHGIYVKSSSTFYSFLSEDNNKDAPDTQYHMVYLYKIYDLMKKF